MRATCPTHYILHDLIILFTMQFENHRTRHGFNHRLLSYTILYEEWQATSN